MSEVRINGQTYRFPSVRIGSRTVISQGKWIKVAAVKDEELAEGDVIPNPKSFLFELKESGLGADIFTFPQKIYEGTPKHDYAFEWDNAAAAATENFAQWWEQLPQEARKNVRRAAKRGVSVRTVDFDDEFVRGIKSIYDESPVRQGMRFWHFGQDFETIKQEQGKNWERSECIGAYYNDELIGFMKFVYVDRVAKIMQILSKISHYDKRPMNALIAKAVEICSAKGISYLVYSKFRFGNKKTSQLAEFKRRNGFKELRFPRFYVPLTIKGKIALRLNLHQGLLGLLPFWLINLLLRIRSALLQMSEPYFWTRRFRSAKWRGSCPSAISKSMASAGRE